MRDESFDDTPNTPVRAPLHLESEDDLPTPTKLSPSVIRLNGSVDSVAGTKAEVAVQEADNTVWLLDGDNVPIIPDTRLEPKREKGEDGGNTIDTTTQQGLDIQTKVDQKAETGIKAESGEAVKDNGAKAAITFTDGRVEEGKGKAISFRGDLSQTEKAKDKDYGFADEFADEFGDDFDDFGEAVEGDDGFDDFEGFEESSVPEFSEPPTSAVPALPVVSHPPIHRHTSFIDTNINSARH